MLGITLMLGLIIDQISHQYYERFEDECCYAFVCDIMSLQLAYFQNQYQGFAVRCLRQTVPTHSAMFDNCWFALKRHFVLQRFQGRMLQQYIIRLNFSTKQQQRVNS